MQIAHSLSIHSAHLRHSPAVTKTDHARERLFIYLFILILFSFICSLFYIWSRIQIVNVGYEINRELLLKEQLIEENKHLTLEVATLKSPVRLEALAKNEYKMDLPQKSQILTFTPVLVAEVARDNFEKEKPSVKKEKVLRSPEKKLSLEKLSKKEQKTLESKIQKASKIAATKTTPKIATVVGMTSRP